MPDRMICNVVTLVSFWLNTLPPSPSLGGGGLSLCQIVTGLTVDDNNH